MINKKGDMPTILLFVITPILAILALFSFASFNGNFAKESSDRDKIINNIVFQQDYIIKESEIIGKKVLLSGGLIMTNEGLKKRFQEIAEKENPIILELNPFFEKIRKGDFEFYNEKANYILKIKDLPIKSESGANTLTRNLNFAITFDINGNTKIYK